MNSDSDEEYKLALDRIREMYTENLAAKGATAPAVGWNTVGCQKLRFERLARVVNDRSTSISVNDYGCGYGAQLNFLQELSIRVNRYNGYDISQRMLQEAGNALRDTGTVVELFESTDIHTVADYTFVCGTFNVRFDAGDDVWQQFIENKLDNICDHSRKGFSFNLLSTYVDWREPHLFYGDPCYWFDHCKRKYSRFVTLHHDYPLYEWTINVWKA